MELCIKSDPRFLKSEQREDKYQKKCVIENVNSVNQSFK